MRPYLLLLLLLGFPAAVLAADCEKVEIEIPLETFSATAGSWDNFRENPGSISFESKRMLASGVAKLKAAKVPAGFSCPATCVIPQTAKLKFSSTPEQFVAEYSDQPKCDQLFKNTKGSPLKYPGQSFDTVELFATWFSEFSQGSGKEGKDLYRKCDGSCSPQYLTLLSPHEQGYTVDAAAVCGPARDKSQNRYILATAIVWQCSSLGVK
jgi:hypothetical protein